MNHVQSIRGQRARYKSKYGKCPVTIIIRDVIYSPFYGLRIQTMNNVFYSWDEIIMLTK